MPGRILNFSEFFDKYSKGGEKDDQGIDSLTNAASNFEDGFDSETYNQNNIGPNRPVSGGSDITPPQPGQAGSPKFTSTPDDSMNAPEEMEEPETEESEEEEESNDTPEPEADEADEMKESKFTGVKGFSEFVNESYDESLMGMNPFEEGEEGEEYYHDGMNDSRFEEETCPGCGMPADRCECEHHEEMETCDTCKEPIIDFGAGPECGCNM